MKKLVTSGLVFSIVTFVLCTNTQPLVTKTDRVYMIGDSNGSLLMYEMPRIAKEYEIVFDGNPVPGSSVISWANSLNEELSKIRAFRPTVILVILGANDAYMGTRIINNELPFLKRLIKKLSRRAVKVIWVGPPKLPRASLALEAFYRMVSPFSVYLDSREIDIEMWSDQLHPSPVGRATWARWIWHKLLVDFSICDNQVPCEDGD